MSVCACVFCPQSFSHPHPRVACGAQVAEYQTAPEKAFRVFDFLVGVALKKLQFKASPGKVNAALRAQLTTPRA